MHERAKGILRIGLAPRLSNNFTEQRHSFGKNLSLHMPYCTPQILSPRKPEFFISSNTRFNTVKNLVDCIERLTGLAQTAVFNASICQARLKRHPRSELSKEPISITPSG